MASKNLLKPKATSKKTAGPSASRAVRRQIRRVAATLDALSDRVSAGARGLARAFDAHPLEVDAGALGRALHRESTAAIMVLIEAAHLSGELVGLASAAGRDEPPRLGGGRPAR